MASCHRVVEEEERLFSSALERTRLRRLSFSRYQTRARVWILSDLHALVDPSVLDFGSRWNEEIVGKVQRMIKVRIQKKYLIEAWSGHLSIVFRASYTDQLMFAKGTLAHVKG